MLAEGRQRKEMASNGKRAQGSPGEQRVAGGLQVLQRVAEGYRESQGVAVTEGGSKRGDP